MAAVVGPLRLVSQFRALRLYRDGLSRVEQLDLSGCEERFRSSLAAARAARSDAMTARAGEQLYMVLRRTRRPQEAVGLAEDLVACHERLRGADHDSTAAWRNELILLLGQLGRHGDAEVQCRARLASARRLHGDPSLEAGLAAVTLGWCLRQQRRYEEAEQACREGLACLESALGAEDERTGWALGGLAEVLARRGESELAEAALVRARLNWDRLGQAEMATAALERLMDLYVASERYTDALELSRRRLAHPGRLAGDMVRRPGASAHQPGPACVPAPGHGSDRGRRDLRAACRGAAARAGGGAPVKRWRKRSI